MAKRPYKSIVVYSYISFIYIAVENKKYIKEFEESGITCCIALPPDGKDAQRGSGINTHDTRLGVRITGTVRLDSTGIDIERLV